MRVSSTHCCASLALSLSLALVAGCRGRTLEAYPEQLVGIGVVVKTDHGQHVVQQLIEGGPAQQAGLVVGGRIVAIDGVPTRGKPLASVVEKLRGKDGSIVVLKVDGPAGVLTTAVTRRTLARNNGGNYRTR